MATIVYACQVPLLEIALTRIPDDPTSLLHEISYPEDAFHGQTYWADLPPKEQAKWIYE